MHKLQKNKYDLSVVIVSYNTRDILLQCLHSLEKEKSSLKFEVIVVDNNSSDGTIQELENFNSKRFSFILVKSNTNLGFSKGNNKARKYVNSDTVLFLNSDTIVHTNSLYLPYEYLKSNDNFGAVTVKTILPDGGYDPDMYRSFPTPFVSLTHFSGLDKVFRSSEIFSKYRYGYLDPEVVNEIDVAQGAYLMAKKEVLDQVDWFDEDYFLDGEDIDLCWKIKETGKKIIYFPDAYITHIKKASKNVDRKRDIKSVTRGVEAMKIFYKKRLSKNYNGISNFIVFTSIDFLKLLRTFKYKINL